MIVEVSMELMCPSPIGILRINAAREGAAWVLSGITIGETDGSADADNNPGDKQLMSPDRLPPILADVQAQLKAYFDGQLRRFAIPLANPRTVFQAQLRAAMLNIPYGETASYAGLAREISSSPRAVGTGCGRNPIPIIVPCHRVVATTGLGGYSGGEGLRTKKDLLAHERRGL